MIEAFGVLDGTQEVQAITLGVKGGLQAQVLTFGGILRRLVFPARGGMRELIITLPDLDAYLRDTTYQGILVGRVANRIGGARFDLKGREYRLTAKGRDLFPHSEVLHLRGHHFDLLNDDRVAAALTRWLA